jgi:lysyl-tRNA synthetase class 2
LKANNKMELGALKSATQLSGKQWDKGMKALSKLGLLKVEVDGDAKVCALV